MTTLSVEEQHLKDIVKQALLEIFEERQDLAEALLLEAAEDRGLFQAIREGEATGPATREAVFDVLERVK